MSQGRERGEGRHWVWLFCLCDSSVRVRAGHWDEGMQQHTHPPHKGLTVLQGKVDNKQFIRTQGANDSERGGHREQPRGKERTGI